MDTHNVVNDSAIWNRSRFSKGFLDFTAWPGADTRNLNRRGSTLWRPLVSVDLRTDEISSTGGHRFFAPFSAENDLNRARTADLWSRAPRTGGSLARFPGVPNPRMTTGAYVCGRENNSACRKNDKQYKNGRPDGRPFYAGLSDQGLAGWY